MQVPQGATPRMMTVHLLGELTRSLKPGNAVSISGIFLPTPYTGFRAMRAGLLTSTYLQVSSRTSAIGLACQVLLTFYFGGCS